MALAAVNMHDPATDQVLRKYPSGGTRSVSGVRRGVSDVVEARRSVLGDDRALRLRPAKRQRDSAQGASWFERKSCDVPASPSIHPALPGDTPAPLPGLLVADFFSQGASYRSRRRMGTRDWLITFTVAGRGLYRLAGQEYGCGPGDVMLLQPGAPHDYGTEPEAGRLGFLLGALSAATDLESMAAVARAGEWAAECLGWGGFDAPADREGLCATVARCQRPRRLGRAASRERAGRGDPARRRGKRPVVRRDHRSAGGAGGAGNQPALSRADDGGGAGRAGASVAFAAGAFVQGGGRRVADPDAAAVAAAPGGALLEYSTLSVAEIAAEVGFDSQFYFGAPVPRAVRDEPDRVSSCAPAEPRNHVIFTAAHAGV